MRDHTEDPGCLICVILAFAVALFVFFTTSFFINDHWESEAIKQGAAHYDPITAEFKWNEPPPKEQNNEEE